MQKTLLLLLIPLFVYSQTYAPKDSVSEGCATSYFSVGLTGRPYIFQKIAVSSNYDLGRVALFIKKNNSPTMDYIVMAYSHNPTTNNPNTAILLTDTFNAADLAADITRTVFTFTSSASVSAGDTVWVGIRTLATDAANYIHWCSLAADAKLLSRRSADGSTWVANSTNDGGLVLYSVIQPDTEIKREYNKYPGWKTWMP